MTVGNPRARDFNPWCGPPDDGGLAAVGVVASMVLIPHSSAIGSMDIAVPMFMSKCVGEIAGVLTVDKPEFPVLSRTRFNRNFRGLTSSFLPLNLRLSTARALK
jgi:hypothetical protein